MKYCKFIFSVIVNMFFFESTVAQKPYSLPLFDKPMCYTSVYGKRKDPFTGKLKQHSGIDIAARADLCLSVICATVTRTGTAKGYGKFVKIESSNGISFIYAHLSVILVKRGEKVMAGDLIGVTGNTGQSTGEHLHLGMYVDGVPVNPKFFIERIAGLTDR